MTERVELYNASYGNFADTIYQNIRLETFGEDIGQNSWLTVNEYRRFLNWLELKSSSKVLEIASGSGGPALFVARTFGCSILGVDINEKGIVNANELSKTQHLNHIAAFQLVDAGKSLPFPPSQFDSIICIDSINHLPDRLNVLKEWHRVLKTGGRLLFTDPIIVTGILSNEEIAIRSSIGFFLFTAVGEDERLIKEAGLELLVYEDSTENMALISKRWYDAREKYRDNLLKIEGKKTFEGQQQFLYVAHQLAHEKRLSRLVFVANKK
ncbi:MAG: class I SAM-dependent methyltransferase [Ignavibacteria bacterium]